MKKLICSLAYVQIVLCILNINICEAQWTPTGAPIGGRVNKIYYNNGIIYAGTKYGCFRSTNNCQSWQETMGQNINVNAIIRSGTILLAGASSSGVYYSTNDGSSWSQSDLNNKSVLSLEVAGSAVYAGTFLYGVYKSTNNGLNWIQTYLNNREVSALHDYNGTLLAGTNSYGIVYSTDEGSSWLPTSMTSQTVNDIESAGNYLYAGTNTGMYTSITNGMTWNYNSTMSLSVTALKAIFNQLEIYAGTKTNGIYKSTNNGANWSQTYFNGQYVRSIEDNGNDLYAGLNIEGLFKSSNGGSNFTKTSLSSIVINSITQSSNKLYIGTDGNGMFSSTNLGMNWTQIGLSDQVITSTVAVENLGQTVLLAGVPGTGGLRTTNGGDNWFVTWNNALNAKILYTVDSDGSEIWLTNFELLKAFWSTDLGANFLESSFANAKPRSVSFAEDYIFIGTENNGIFRRPKSVDVWTQTSLTTYTVNSLGVLNNTLYAGTQSNGIKTSTDNGASFVQSGLNGLNVTNIFVGTTGSANYSVDNFVFAGTQSNGIYFKKNNSDWIQANQGLAIASVNTMILSNNNLIIATNRPGIWTRPITEFVIGINSISSEVPPSFSLSQNYPNPFNLTTKIKFSVPQVRHLFGGSSPSASIGNPVKLIVYDIMGREVQILVNEAFQPGTYEATFDGSMLTSGVYFYRLQAGNYTDTKRMILIK